MVRKLSALAIVVFSLSAISTAALAAPPTMNLSSWQPIVENGAIVGGTQTVTVTNITSETMDDVAFSLATAPCDCVVTEASPSNGGIQGDAWVIGELAPEATVTLTLLYGQRPLTAVGAPGRDSLIPAGTELAAVGLVMAAGALLGYRRRLSPAIA